MSKRIAGGEYRYEILIPGPLVLPCGSRAPAVAGKQTSNRTFAQRSAVQANLAIGFDGLRLSFDALSTPSALVLARSRSSERPPKPQTHPRERPPGPPLFRPAP